MESLKLAWDVTRLFFGLLALAEAEINSRRLAQCRRLQRVWTFNGVARTLLCAFHVAEDHMWRTLLGYEPDHPTPRVFIDPPCGCKEVD